MAEPLPSDDQREARIAKLARLRAAGVDPYPYRFARTHLSSELHERFEELEGQEVAVAGRLVGALRVMGKAGFVHLQDAAGRIQLFCRANVLGPEGFAFFTDLLDTGDFVGAVGTLMRTQKGEISVQPRELTLLAKGLRPLPEKWHGLQDVEKRYRQRYLDLLTNERSRAVFEKRIAIVRETRRFFDERGFLEVETPILQTIAGGAAAEPFSTHHNALDVDLYLRIAPELYLKRLVVGGYERVFELSRNFRNEGISRKH